jgi:hypothetical protein
VLIKIIVFLKKRLDSTFLKVLLSKKWRFWRFLGQKVQETGRFHTFWADWKAYLTSLTPPTTTPRDGHSPYQ